MSSEDGSGTFTPALNVQESGSTTTVTVKVQEAADLSEAYLHLSYDATKYTPTDVKFGDFLGSNDQVITLALTEKAGEVQLGAAQIANGGAVPQDGVGVLATVTFEQVPFTGARQSSAFPDGAANAVTDLKIKTQVGNDVTLEWTERNKGDYNNNGVVGISDLSPIALYYGQQVVATSDPIHANMIDGDQNGEVNIADLSPIGGNLDNQITGYNIYSNAAGTTMVTVVTRPGTVDPKRPVVYTQQLTVSGGEEFTVRPVGTTSGETGTESNVAAPQASEPGEPQAPTNLAATVDDQNVGSMKIKLTWTASTSTDVDLYSIERKLSTEPDTSFAQIVTVPGNLTQYTDQTGLTDNNYDYRLWSIDFEALTSLAPSNTATGNPYASVISAPTNLTAVTGTGPAGVDLDWDDSVDPNVFHYRVYRKGPGEPNFSVVTTVPKVQGSQYADNGLTEFETYEYYVTGVDFAQSGESAPSNTASADASQALVLAIVSVTTDKTTHHNSGSEAASNIVGVANTPLATWSWSATAGTVTGTGDAVTWKPDAGDPVGSVTITATAQLGAQSVSQDLQMIVTNLTLKTHHADRGGGGNLPIGGGTGKVPALTLTPFQYLAPLKDNPTKAITTYTGTLAQYTAGKVVLYDRWELWCGPCKAEFPELDDYAQDYEPHGYMQVSLSNDTAPQYSCAEIANWFDANGIDYCHQFFETGNNGMDAFWDPGMGYDYYIPYNVLCDKDGNARKTGGQAFGWDADIAQLCGVPVI